MIVRRCPTLPHTPVCSTIGAVGLSFRVRNGTGRFPYAITTVTLLTNPQGVGVGNLVFDCVGLCVSHTAVFVGVIP